MKRMLLILCLTAFCVGIGSVAFAGPHDNARFAMHVTPKFTASKTVATVCANSPAPSAIGGTPGTNVVPCTSYNVNTAPNLFPGNQVYVVIGQAGNVGVVGASFGIDYTPGEAGISQAFITWDVCTDGLQFPNAGANGDFPAPGGGIRLTWSNCQNADVGGIGVHTTAGVFYIYAYGNDTMSITPNNNLASGPELALSACGGGTTDFLQLFPPEVSPLTSAKVGVGVPGYNPCGVVPVLPATWGKIKNQYQEAGE